MRERMFDHLIFWAITLGAVGVVAAAAWVLPRLPGPARAVVDPCDAVEDARSAW